MKTFLNAIKKYFVDIGTAVAKGDIWCKLSLLVMGAGYWGRKQIVKGVLITALEVVVILFTGMFSINYIKDLKTKKKKKKKNLVPFSMSLYLIR